MKRKDFLKSTAIASSGLFLSAQKSNATISKTLQKSIIPPYLKAGDLIGITSPAGYITREDILPACKMIYEWGYNIRSGYTIGKRDFTFGGTDEERLQDFQSMLDDPSIKAIMCARGGYGAVRIVDKIDWTKFKKNPKWIIGFSDITVLHSHIHQNLGIATIHSKMCNSFPSDWALASDIQKNTILSINNSLKGFKNEYKAEVNSANRLGKAKGVLVGGNLKTIETLSASKSDINTDGKILLVEDTGEYMYSIDRMFWNLKRSGKLEQLSGLVIGGFKVKPDDPSDYFGKTLEEVVMEKLKEYSYPVCFNFPVGHQIDNYAVKLGVEHEIDVQAHQVSLKEI
ncbi:MAG: LD-carboxypeptidase [Chitinophagaceae bacterium]|nr:MAG: LD-carboxypeptidase [Chitinophagaceae bacterium]